MAAEGGAEAVVVAVERAAVVVRAVMAVAAGVVVLAARVPGPVLVRAQGRVPELERVQAQGLVPAELPGPAQARGLGPLVPERGQALGPERVVRVQPVA